MQILDGKKLSEKILNSIKDRVVNEKITPSLAVILANNSDASKVYVSKKERVSKELGFTSWVFRFDENVKQKEIIDLIERLNNDNSINAILVQLPLFSHLDKDEILNAIEPKKDVDGFHPINMGMLAIGLEPYAIPCTPKGIIRLLKEYSIEIAGKHVVISGRSNIVGKPAMMLFLKENATVSLIHSKTKNPEEFFKKADIIVSATGVKNLVKTAKQGAVVVDVGIIRDENNKLTGDVDFNSVKDIVSAITPVPGGVGPMTIAMLMENTLELSLKQKGN